MNAGTFSGLRKVFEYGHFDIEGISLLSDRYEHANNSFIGTAMQRSTEHSVVSMTTKIAYLSTYYNDAQPALRKAAQH